MGGAGPEPSRALSKDGRDRSQQLHGWNSSARGPRAPKCHPGLAAGRGDCGQPWKKCAWPALARWPRPRPILRGQEGGGLAGAGPFGTWGRGDAGYRGLSAAAEPGPPPKLPGPPTPHPLPNTRVCVTVKNVKSSSGVGASRRRDGSCVRPHMELITGPEKLVWGSSVQGDSLCRRGCGGRRGGGSLQETARLLEGCGQAWSGAAPWEGSPAHACRLQARCVERGDRSRRGGRKQASVEGALALCEWAAARGLCPSPSPPSSCSGSSVHLFRAVLCLARAPALTPPLTPPTPHLLPLTADSAS